MKVSFPHMGCVTGFKQLMEKLGHEVIMPQKPTQRTMELGVKYSPEFICFPFKVILGTYIECAEAGAELIISSGGSGPCRAGMYPDIHQKILEELGYKTKIIVFDSIFEDFSYFLEKAKTVLNGTSIPKALGIAKFTFHLIRKMDTLEKRLKIDRAYEENIGDYDHAWAKIVKSFEACKTTREVNKAYKEANRIFDAIPKRHVEEKDKLRMGIVGEIYVVMESSVNKNVEQILNSLGVEVENVQYISDWVLHNIQPRWGFFTKSRRVLKNSDSNAPLNCGGHDKENLGWVYDFAKRGFDGVIHLMPFACLPELVNLSKLPGVSTDLSMPILSLSLDEQTGEAHIKTRLEAFTDLARSKHYARLNKTNSAGQSIDEKIEGGISKVGGELGKVKDSITDSVNLKNNQPKVSQ
uniref:CoA protein activase n=1 Tax=uncultured Bacillota bacterium TaxID=344338 RepID=A0A650EN68_9FIRM|nr:hypothetical protein Firmicute1046_1890 [uncultured Firmicutes bacterium]